MIDGRRIIAVIPARGGSKNVPGKNIKLLNGKPLIAWSIDVARRATEVDRIIVSTDDEVIRSVALEYGAEAYERPVHLATDDALVVDALRDLYSTLINEGETAEIFILLEPTCPLRTLKDVRACLFHMTENGLDSVATFKPAELNPHRAWRIEDGRAQTYIEGSDPWQARQKLPEAYQLNGAVYVFNIKLLSKRKTNSLLFGKHGAVVMPTERSVDIDRELDFTIAEVMLRKKR
jgi:N-acylneuraminate cytidylyltransferase